MREYIKNITKTNDLVLDGTLGSDEINRFAKSDYRWADNKNQDVYHPIDNNKSKSDLYLLKSSDYLFIQHDSVLKLNDIRTISINRILYQQKDGRIDIESLEYKVIEELVLNKYFPSFLYEFKNCISDKQQLEAEICRQKQEITDLETKIIELEAKANKVNEI